MPEEKGSPKLLDRLIRRRQKEKPPPTESITMDGQLASEIWQLLFKFKEPKPNGMQVFNTEVASPILNYKDHSQQTEAALADINSLLKDPFLQKFIN